MLNLSAFTKVSNFWQIPDIAGCQSGHQSDGATPARLFLGLNLEEERLVCGGRRLCGCRRRGESRWWGAARYVGWGPGPTCGNLPPSLPLAGPASPAPPRLSTHQGMLLDPSIYLSLERAPLTEYVGMRIAKKPFTFGWCFIREDTSDTK